MVNKEKDRIRFKEKVNVGGNENNRNGVIDRIIKVVWNLIGKES